MIYWHVECPSLCVYSQLKTCSSAEVAATTDGLIRHAADVDASRIATNYTDAHGATLGRVASRARRWPMPVYRRS